MSKKSFFERIYNFDPNSITAKQLKELIPTLQNQDLKEQRLAIESPLAADLCRWAKASAKVAKSSTHYNYSSDRGI